MTTPAGCTRTLTPSDAAQLQAILDESPAGAVLCLGAGSYEVANLVMRTAISLRGTANSPDAVILDGGNHGPVLQLWADGGDAERYAISSLTVRGGVASASIGVGGVYIHGTAPVTFDRVTFTANACDSAGAQALYTDAGRVTLDHCRIEGNFGERSGAVTVEGIGTLTAKDSTISLGEGRRVLTVRDAGQLTLERTTVEAGSATALEISGNPSQTPTANIVDSKVTGARAINNGPMPGKVTLKGSTISGSVTGPVEDGGKNTLPK